MKLPPRKATKWEDLFGRKILHATDDAPGLTLVFEDMVAFVQSTDYCQFVRLFRETWRIPIQAEELVGKHITGVVARHFAAGWWEPGWTELKLSDGDSVKVATEDPSKTVEIAPEGFGRRASKWEDILGRKIVHVTEEPKGLEISFGEIDAFVESTGPSQPVRILRETPQGMVAVQPKDLVRKHIAGVIARQFESGRGDPGWTELVLCGGQGPDEPGFCEFESVLLVSEDTAQSVTIAPGGFGSAKHTGS